MQFVDKGTRFIPSFLVSHVEERPLRPIQSPNKGRKKKSDEEIRSNQIFTT